MWAFINESGGYDLHINLPDSWKNISNFFALENDVDYLASMNWYRVVDDTVPITDSLTQYLGDPVYTLDVDNKVVRKFCEIKSKGVSEEQVQALTADEFFRKLRTKRDELLKESDWTQGADLQDLMSDEWKTSWKTYRKDLRDLPKLYENGIVDFEQILWPYKPSVLN